MATITGYTAEKTLEILDTIIVDGDVVGDELFLTTRGGASINAGTVRGPAGTDAATGDVNPTAATTPIRASGGRVKGGTATAADDLTTKAQMDTADTAVAATAAASSATNASNIAANTALILGTEIGNAVNLDSLTTSGLYIQTSDAEAAAGTNYPVATGGTLEVMSNAAHGLIIQQYVTFADSGTIYQRRYTGTWGTWKTFAALSAAMPAAVTSSTSGTETVSTTETRDAVHGNYTFTALAGHSYRVVLDNSAGVCTVLNDQFAIHIRNGGASTPTASSTLIASSRLPCWNNSIALPIVLGGKFTPGAGTQTLAVFCVRLAGTGTMHMFGDSALPRALYVMDLGV